MHRVSRALLRALLVILASVSLAVTPGFVAAQSPSSGEQTANEAKQSSSGVDQPSNNGGTSASETAKPAAPGAGQVGDRLHDSAKGFGEAIVDGFKYVGRTIAGFFNGEKPKK
jgi:hypothetical protein